MRKLLDKKIFFKDIDQDWTEIFKQDNIENDILNILSNIDDFDNIYPASQDIFSVFKLVKPKDIKVIILGQDPYHGKNQANGIAFSTSNNVATPPSLKNIFKELWEDLTIDHFDNNDLSSWVKQGVLLLNTSLTVEKNKPNSHKDLGWEQVIIKILNFLKSYNDKIIYCLWGNYAKNLYNKFINDGKELENCIFSSHPSPFSCRNGFQNSKPFSKINSMLTQRKESIIDWKM